MDCGKGAEDGEPLVKGVSEGMLLIEVPAIPDGVDVALDSGYGTEDDCDDADGPGCVEV